MILRCCAKFCGLGLGIRLIFLDIQYLEDFALLMAQNASFFFEKYNLPLLRVFEVAIFGVAMDTFIFDGESCGCNEIR